MPDKPFRVPHNRSTTGSCKPPVPFSPHLGMHCLFRLWSCLPRVPVPLCPVPLRPVPLRPVPLRPVPLWGVSQIPHRETPLPNWIKMHNGASRLLGSGFQDRCRPKRIRISCEPTVDIRSLTSYTYRSIRWPLGEIGRHARLRIWCREASGFDSPSGHCRPPVSRMLRWEAIFLRISFQRETLKQIGNRLDKRTDFKSEQPASPLCGKFAGREGSPARGPNPDRWGEKHCHRASKRYSMHGYLHLPEGLGGIEPSTSRDLVPNRAWT